jgi:hypothetical protein
MAIIMHQFWYTVRQLSRPHLDTLINEFLIDL